MKGVCVCVCVCAQVCVVEKGTGACDSMYCTCGIIIHVPVSSRVVE